MVSQISECLQKVGINLLFPGPSRNIKFNIRIRPKLILRNTDINGVMV